jgi:hypothetical protein
MTRATAISAAPVVSQSAPGKSSSALLQRECACEGKTSLGGVCEECGSKQLQRKPNGRFDGGSVPSIVHEVLRSPGQPLDSRTRAFMEPRLGHSFGGIRIHTDGKAAESARAVNALAYTVGRDVVFEAGKYAPSTRVGQELIAHELTHTVQQKSSSVSGDIILGSDDSSEREARQVAQQVSSGKPIPEPSGITRTFEDNRILRRAANNEPAGGCGVCRSPTLAGTDAHTRIQGLFKRAYRDINTEASFTSDDGTKATITSADYKENGRLDLIRINRSSVPTLVEIGEIKPDNDQGREDGKRDLGFYRTEVQKLLKGPSFAVEFLDVAAPPAQLSIVEKPSCRAQILTVRNTKLGGQAGLYLYSCNPPASQIDKSCCQSKAKDPEPAPTKEIDSQPAQRSEGDKQLDQALGKVREAINALARQLSLNEGDHKAQLDLIFKPSFTGFAGFWTNRLFNTDPPDTAIWANVHGSLAGARRALSERKLEDAVGGFVRARRAYLIALKRYLNWKQGIPGAAKKMEHAIEIVAVGIVLAFVAPTVVARAASFASSGASTAVATEQTVIRIADAVAKADRVMIAADAAMTETEILAEAELEAEMEMLNLLKF